MTDLQYDAYGISKADLISSMELIKGLLNEDIQDFLKNPSELLISRIKLKQDVLFNIGKMMDLSFPGLK